MTQSLTKSVGQGGANKPLDVVTLQLMFNSLPAETGAPASLIATDGVFGSQTLSAINSFQQVQFKVQDGLVQPRDFTMDRLNTLVDALNVSDPLALKWSALKDSGTLDMGPSSGEAFTHHDGVGMAQNFEQGMIHHHPSLGAFEVHGSILFEYQTLGAQDSTLGYPISDEREWVAGGGRVSHFQFGSIFFTPPGDVSVLEAPGAPGT